MILKILLIIMASLCLYGFINLLIKMKSGYFYYLKYPIAKEIEDLAQQGNALSMSELRQITSALDPRKCKDDAIKEFHELVARVRNNEVIESFHIR